MHTTLPAATPAPTADRADPADAPPARGERLMWALLAFGVILRLFQYLANRSLWMDEALVASAVLEPPFAELLNPGAWGATPPGFLFATRFVGSALGGGELALRLVPLAGGIAALFLFRAVAARALSPRGALFALALFAASPYLIYYASEVKPYSTDAAVALALVWGALRLVERGVTWRGAGLLWVGGVAAVGFSYPAALVLAGVTAALVLHSAARRDAAALRRLGAAALGWAVVFGVPYLLFVRGSAANEYAQAFWRSGFMPLPPRSLAEALWLPRAILRAFVEPLGALDVETRPLDRVQALAGVAVFAVGAAAMLRGRRRTLLAVLTLPVAATLAASALHKYPFGGDWSTGGRVILFLAPLFYLVMGEGGAAAWARGGRAGRIAGRALVAAAWVPLVAGAAVAFPFARAEVRPVLEYVRDQWRPGDVLYVHYDLRPAFRYYAPRYGFGPGRVRMGRCSRFQPVRYLADLSSLGGRGRVWVMMGGGKGAYNYDEKALITGFLNAAGTRLDDRVSMGATVYLYDLSDLQRRVARYRVRAPAFPEAIEEGCAIFGGE